MVEMGKELQDRGFYDMEPDEAIKQLLNEYLSECSDYWDEKRLDMVIEKIIEINHYYNWINSEAAND